MRSFRNESGTGIGLAKLQFYEIQKISKNYAQPTKSDDEILPLRLLLDRSKRESSLRFDSDDGIPPLKWLFDIS